MALAPLVYTIWNDILRFDPQNPIWPNRDRFVLSNGHASMLLWSVLYLTRTQAVNAETQPVGKPSVTLDDIKHFRQLGSKAPGHPEYHGVSGVEATTGPLGQGVAMSVGMAIARKWLANHYNKPGFDIFDYNIYAICGDGCLMEGVSSEAASLAGHLQLDDLCWIYDNNHITIEGNTKITFTEDVAARFLAYRWNVLRVGDANDTRRIEDALAIFRKTEGRPTLIILDSHIGYGSPHKVDTAAAHGEPLGEDEVRLVKRHYGWPENAKFLVPDGVMERFADGIGKRGARARREWEARFAGYREQFPQLATEIDQMQRRELPAGWDRDLQSFPADPKGIAAATLRVRCLTRSPRILRGFWAARPISGLQIRQRSNSPMPETSKPKLLEAAIFISAFASMRWRQSSTVCRCRNCAPSARRSSSSATMPGRRSASPPSWSFRPSSCSPMTPWVTARMGHRISPLSGSYQLRAVPGLVVFRPADANEVVETYRCIMQLRHEPAAIALSRQPLPTFDRRKYASAAGAARGAYVMADAPGGPPEIILIASGSEVSLVVAAHETLMAQGIRSRVVSMPSWDVFEHQPPSYRDDVLPPTVKARIAVEQGSVLGWDRYAGAAGRIIGMKFFGASAPLKELQHKFGFEPERVVTTALEMLGRA